MKRALQNWSDSENLSTGEGVDARGDASMTQVAGTGLWNARGDAGL